MKTKTKNVYYCDFCKKHGLSKHAMEYHEKICSYNPANHRPCQTCVFLEKVDYGIYSPYPEQDNERNVQIFHCEAKNIFMHTPQNEIKGNVFDLGFEINHPMPKECDIQRSYEIF